jgi:hypothetical protein
VQNTAINMKNNGPWSSMSGDKLKFSSGGYNNAESTVIKFLKESVNMTGGNASSSDWWNGKHVIDFELDTSDNAKFVE